MNTRRLFFCSLLATMPVLAFAYFLKADDPDAVLGIWLTGSGKAHIQIYKDKNRYYGKIVWLREPLNEQGKPKVDKNNPDKAKKTQPLLGLQNLRDFVYDGDNTWVDGRIYDPEKGKDYSCKMELVDANTLEVRGFIGISLLGRTDTWKRQPSPHK